MLKEQQGQREIFAPWYQTVVQAGQILMKKLWEPVNATISHHCPKRGSDSEW